MTLSVVEELNQSLQRLFPEFDGFKAKRGSLQLRAEYRGIGIILDESAVRQALETGGVAALERVALKFLNR